MQIDLQFPEPQPIFKLRSRLNLVQAAGYRLKVNVASPRLIVAERQVNRNRRLLVNAPLARAIGYWLAAPLHSFRYRYRYRSV